MFSNVIAVLTLAATIYFGCVNSGPTPPAEPVAQVVITISHSPGAYVDMSKYSFEYKQENQTKVRP